MVQARKWTSWILDRFEGRNYFTTIPNNRGHLRVSRTNGLPMTTSPIFYRFTGSRGTVALAGVVAVVSDMILYRFFRGRPESLELAARALSVLLIVCFLLVARRATPATLGLSATGFGRDARWIGMVSAVVLAGYVVLSLAFAGACRIGLVDPARVLAERDFTNLDQFRRYLLVGLIIAPVFEELVYRSLAVPALAAWLGNGLAIFLSGPLFYFLHIVIYGRPWFLFHYALAGWILAWAFIRCNKVWTPMLLHSLGNVLMGTGQALLLFAPRFVGWLLGKDL
jgi:membrane protease YdiL (CAAX protease family)